MGLFSNEKSGGPFEFKVSDALEVPLRGYLLRLKLASGTPSIGDIGPGKKIRLRAPDGSENVITIMDWSVTQGPPSQKRLDRTRELDVMIDGKDAMVGGRVVDIGWTAASAD